MGSMRGCSLFLALLFGCASAPEVVPDPLGQALAASLAAWEARIDEEPRAVPWKLSPLDSPGLSDIPYRDIVDSDRPVPGSFSLGTASRGELVRAVTIPIDGDNLFIIEPNIVRNAHYATEELYRELRRTADLVEEAYPGSRLPLGDLSGPEGGRIRNHASHRSGRDVDIVFFAMNAAGQRVESERFVDFNRHGRGHGLRFDVERNWLVAKVLLESPTNEVQWLFIAEWLEEILIEHAEEIGEDARLIARARDAMRQPSDSSPHADHFHVRLFCSELDLLEGCLNYGPQWAWASHHAGRHQARIDELLRGLDDQDHAVRWQVVDFLIRINAVSAGPALAHRVGDQPPPVQTRILQAIERFQPDDVGRHIVEAAVEADAPEMLRAALQTITSYPLSDSAPHLARLAQTDAPEGWDGDWLISREAARVLLEFQDEVIVPQLIEALDSHDPETRELVATVLGRTTGRQSEIDWAAGSEAGRIAACNEWDAWYLDHRDEPRALWLRHAFFEIGYELPDNLSGVEALRVFVDALDGPEPLTYYALAQLQDATGERAPPERWSLDRRQRHWEVILNRLD
jgi:penicillin-insensitive murein endopeptidase